MSPAVRFGIMLASGIMAVIWTAYVGMRGPQISLVHACDQCGIAATLVAVLMLVSDLLGRFDR